MIKKRSSKPSNLRKPVSDNDDDESGVGDGDEKATMDISQIALVRAEQQMRRLKNGLSVDASSNISDTKPTTSSSSATMKTISSMISTQFSSIGEMSTSSIGHEKIMEAYINDRLGIKAEPKEKIEKPRTLEDDLYRVPEEIRALEGKSREKAAVSDDLLPVSLPGSMGIAEVALPMRFKEANIRATTAARKNIEDENGLEDMQALAGGKRELSHALVGTSTDNQAFIKFRKTLKNFRR